MKPYPVFTVYGTESSHYCAMAREILENNGQQYNYVEVTKSPEIQKAFFEKTDYAKQVPQIFVDEPIRGYEVWVGGYDDLRAWLAGNYRARGSNGEII